MGVEANGWGATDAKKRIFVIAQPFDLYLVEQARKAESDGPSASVFVEQALRKFIEEGENGGAEKASETIHQVAARRAKGDEQLSRRSIRLHGDVDVRLDAFAHRAGQPASVIVEAAMDAALNGEIQAMRAHLAEAQRIELSFSSLEN
jgi:hypothetical protein